MRTLDKPFDFLVLRPSRVRFSEASFRNYVVIIGGMWLELGLRLDLSG